MRTRIILGVIVVLAVLAATAFSVLILNPKPLPENAVRNFSFAVKPSVRQCAGPQDNVVGMQSAAKSFGEFRRKIARARRALREISDAHTYSIRLKYTVAITSETQDMNIQDITLMLPEDFHNNLTYELSCKSNTTGEDVVFRKFSPKLYNHNYEEPPVSILPHDCVALDGEVLVRVADTGPSGLAVNELSSSIFRAALWNPASRTVDPADLELFVPHMSYRPGDRISFYAHAADESAPGVLDLIHAGKDEILWKRIEGIHLKNQKISPYSYRDGLDWPVTAQIDLPADVPPGYYVAVLHQNDKRTAFPFVISPAHGDKTPIAIIAATNTWQAYNGWGGGSFYENVIGEKCLATDYARLISTQRPTAQPYALGELTIDDHLFRPERAIAAWFDAHAIKYAVYTDDDLHANPHLLDDHAIALLPTHTEYYTTQMYDALQRHADRGGDIISLGGDAVYYKIAKKGNQMEKHENGRLFDLLAGEFGGYWTNHFDRSPAALLGVEYDARDYATYAPYKVLHPENPIFAGTGLAAGDLFGADGSGHELDVVSDKSPKNVVVLAKGTNPHGFGADMVMFDQPSGAKIFAVGSISFAYGLAHDEKLGMVLNNVINLMLANKQAPVQP